MMPGEDFIEGSVEAFGYPLRYVEAGTGEIIVSLPGSAGLEMSTAKDMLAKRFRVIEINPPGWGDTASVTGTMRQRELAAILAAAIAELGITRYHLIGSSMGGANAFWLARQHPDRVLSLVLEGPMVFVRPEDHVRPPEGPPLGKLLREGLVHYDDSFYPAPPPHPRKPWATAEFFHEQMRRRFKMMAYIDYVSGDMIDESPLAEFARSMTIPVTLVLGTHDEILRASYADRFAQMVPTATIAMIAGATHDAQNSAPEAFVEAVCAQIK